MSEGPDPNDILGNLSRGPPSAYTRWFGPARVDRLHRAAAPGPRAAHLDEETDHGEDLGGGPVQCGERAAPVHRLLEWAQYGESGATQHH